MARSPISSDLHQELLPDQLDIGFRGAIIAAGFCQKPEALETAANVPVRGLILGSMSSDLVPLAESINYPILVIDGFGTLPMNKAAEEILVTNKDKNVALNAQALDPFLGKYPEVIISQNSQTNLNIPSEVENLRVGKKVIIINGPDRNKIGKIEAIPARKQPLHSGIHTRVDEVLLHNDRRTAVPLNNLEILK